MARAARACWSCSGWSQELPTRRPTVDSCRDLEHRKESGGESVSGRSLLKEGPHHLAPWLRVVTLEECGGLRIEDRHLAVESWTAGVPTYR